MITRRHAANAPKLMVAALATLATLAAFADDGVSDAARKQGLAKAPEIVKTSGIACTVSDARKMPPEREVPKDDRTTHATASNGGGHNSISGMSSGGSASQTFTMELDYGAGNNFAGPSAEKYEVACREGLGYVINIAPGQKASAYLCIEALGSAESGHALAPCALTGNSEATQVEAVNAYIAKSGVHCTATQVRGIGHNAQATLMEAACSNGDGYILQASNPLRSDQPVHAVNCMGVTPSPQVSCQWTDAAAQLTAAEKLLGQAQPGCRVTARRYVGTGTTGGRFFEFMCQDNRSFMLKQGSDGALAGAVACTDPAVASLGGCKLTSTTS